MTVTPFTVHTSPDNLPYPGPADYNDPADAPLALQALAQSTQSALNNHMDVTVSIGEVVAGGGWAHYAGSYGNARLYRTGKLIVCMGLLKRTAPLTIADNTLYPLGTVPAGYTPRFDIRAACGWVALNGTSRQYMATQVQITTGGAVSVQSNVAGSMAVDDWVSFGGISWVLP